MVDTVSGLIYFVVSVLYIVKYKTNEQQAKEWNRQTVSAKQESCWKKQTTTNQWLFDCEFQTILVKNAETEDNLREVIANPTPQGQCALGLRSRTFVGTDSLALLSDPHTQYLINALLTD